MGNVQVLKVQVENAIKNGDVVSFDYVDRYGVESHRANVEFEQHMGANLYAGFDQEREGYRRFYLEDMTDFKVKQVQFCKTLGRGALDNSPTYLPW